MSLFRTHKQRIPFRQVIHTPKSSPRFIPIPVPPPIDNTLPLSAILDEKHINTIQENQQIVFHALGDTGGIYGTEVQEAIAEAMEAQFSSTKNPPAFFYHLGDIVYYNGLSSLYSSQFYEPYKYYPGVIFAIPGNHDGDTQVNPGDTPDTEPSLYGYFRNFCAPQRTAIDTYRDSMTQPYAYWTLEAPFVTIIGLYGNVDGTLDGAGTVYQQQWLTSQLEKAGQSSNCIIIAVHQPPYSLDAAHGGYPSIGDAIDQAATATGVWPHAVFSGHVHNYQRFNRRIQIDNQSRDIPYIIAGAGGYANTAARLHKLRRDVDQNPLPFPLQTNDPAVELLNYNESNPGFLRVTVTPTNLTADYFVVPFTGAVPTTPFDSVTITY